MIEKETAAQVVEIIARPFDSHDIEWRLTRSGVKSGGQKWAICIPYITARAVHSRLDEAFGPFNWRCEFRVESVPNGASGIICRLWYRHPEITGGNWEWKENGAGQSEIEPFKGGLSDAEKRAFEQLGGGRYLYSLEESFAEVSDKQTERTPNWAKMSEKQGGEAYYWGPPALPDFAIPPAKLAVREAISNVMGSELHLPEDYATFDSICELYNGKRGVNDLRMVGITAKRKNWPVDQLMMWIAKQGVDLSAKEAKEADFKRLRSALEKGE
ncbi:MAG: Rad52/Rad22 family DNA repair protein [Candidatus Paceibacterota bacterium]|jgi:hypothetical protein